MTLGFIGTGGMGSGMASNLLKRGFGLVIYDIRREASRGLESQGAVFKESPRAVAEGCEVVLSMLPYNEAVRAVAVGRNGLRDAACGARTWIECSSVDKQTILDVAGELSKNGWQVLDASAGGVEEYAAAGLLSLWVSGPRELFDRYLSIFEAMGKKILHVGDLGNAKLVKNATAMLSAIEHLALAEIFHWLRKGGVPEETFLNVLRNSLNHSEGRERTGQAMVSRKFKPRKSWMPKDVAFGLEMGKAMETPMPLTALAYQLFSVAQANGLDGFEATGIAHYVYEVLSGQSEETQEARDQSRS